jgi:hypothetical protein
MRYRYEDGDKDVTKGRMTLHSRFRGATPDDIVLQTIDWKYINTVAKANPDLSATIDQRIDQTNVINGEELKEDKVVNKSVKTVLDASGRPANVPGSYRIRFSDVVDSGEFLWELPEQPVGVGATWTSFGKDLPMQHSAVHCRLAKIWHERGHTYAGIDAVCTMQRGKWKRGKMPWVEVVCHGIADIRLVFNVDAGRFEVGQGLGVLQFDDTVHYQGQTYPVKGVANLAIKIDYSVKQ